MTTLRWGASTDVGRVRTNNEDSLLVEPPLFAVADGVGGHAAGEVASAIAVATLKAAFALGPEHASRDGLADAVRQANEAIYARAAQDPNLRGMGTTLTAIALVHEEEDVLAVVNVGDSRAYRLRDGELEQITDDHSLVEELVRAGQITPAEASVHPQRNIVTRALGLLPDVEVDCFGILPYAGDRFVLASDGLTDEVDDRGIASILRRIADPEEAARELVDTAKDHGGRDNVTVVVVDVVDDDDRSHKAAALVAATPTTARPTETPQEADDGPRAAGPPPAPSTRAAPPPQPTAHPRQRRLTARAALFVLALLLVLAGAAAAIGVYARGSYYVGQSKGRVAIFQGRPGGLLWFKPTVAQRTDLATADVPAAYKADVQSGKTEPSLGAARRYVANLKQVASEQKAQADNPASTTTTSPAPPADAPPTSAPRP
jgi:serine/threonine protein phosphatase PrpC